MMSCNTQALINISRKRLCKKAHEETIKVWQAVKEAIAELDPVVAKYMVRECVYRGFCPEEKSCGKAVGKHYEEELIKYRTRNTI